IVPQGTTARRRRRNSTMRKNRITRRWVGDSRRAPACSFTWNPTMTESFAELFEQSQSLAKLRSGAIVSGIAVDIPPRVVVVNAGLKSEGIIPIEQFKNEKGELEIHVGDEVKVALDAIENGFGETMLSREKAKRSLVWDELEEAQTANAAVTGRISGKVK